MMRLLPLLALTGCPFIGAETHDNNFPDTDQDTLAPLDEYTIDSVTPDFAPAGVRTDVTITGGPFNPDNADAYQVYFGDERVRVLDVSETTIEVEVPVQTVTGYVDVEVADDDETAIAESAFRFYANGGGRTGAFGYLEILRHSTTLTWPTAGSDVARAFVVFNDGTTTISPWAMYAETLDTCRNGNPGIAVNPVALDDETLSLTGGGETLWMPRDLTTAGAYGIEVPLEIANSAFDLAAATGSAEFPPFELDDAFWAANPIALSQPDFSTTSTPYTSQNGFYLNWTAGTMGWDRDSNSGEYIAAIITVYDANWSSEIERVTCAAIDDGQFRVIPSAFTAWTAGNNMVIQVGRVSTYDGTFEHNSSQPVLNSMEWTIGPVQQR